MQLKADPMQPVQAFIVHPAGGEDTPIAPSEALAAIGRGETVRLKNALQACGLLEDITQASHDAVASVATKQTSGELAAIGFEQLHTLIDGEQIFRAEGAVTARLEPKVHDIISKVLRKSLGFAENFYSCGKLWVRFLLPQDAAAPYADLFASRMGHLKPQNPHRDSFFTNPTNGIAIWMAIGKVSPGNGMLMYPDIGRRFVASPDYLENGFKIAPSEPLGRPMNFALEPGDALLFDIEQFHSSEVNITSETRYVITAKFALEPPTFPEGDRWLVHRDDRLMGTPFEFMASLRSRLTATYVKYLLRRRLLYWFKLLRQRLFGTPIKRSVSPPPLEAPQRNHAVADGQVDLSSLKEGEIRAVSEDYCVARSDEGVFAFSRRCPHEGADLACGYIEHGDIRCAWHNLPFDLKSGEQPCRSMGNLNIRPLREVADGQYEWPLELEIQD